MSWSIEKPLNWIISWPSNQSMHRLLVGLFKWLMDLIVQWSIDWVNDTLDCVNHELMNHLLCLTWKIIFGVVQGCCAGPCAVLCVCCAGVVWGLGKEFVRSVLFTLNMVVHLALFLNRFLKWATPWKTWGHKTWAEAAVEDGQGHWLLGPTDPQIPKGGHKRS